MTFFIDNNLSPQLAEGLKGFGEDAMHLRDEFAPETPDSEWLRYVGEHGMCVISRDNRILSRPLELCALRKSRVGVFFLRGNQRTRCELIQQLVRNWPRVKALAAETERPFAFGVRPNGTVIDRLPL